MKSVFFRHNELKSVKSHLVEFFDAEHGDTYVNYQPQRKVDGCQDYEADVK